MLIQIFSPKLLKKEKEKCIITEHETKKNKLRSHLTAEGTIRSIQIPEGLLCRTEKVSLYAFLFLVN